jgi:hypothetical protein
MPIHVSQILYDKLIEFLLSGNGGRVTFGNNGVLWIEASMINSEDIICCRKIYFFKFIALSSNISTWRFGECTAFLPWQCGFLP